MTNELNEMTSTRPERLPNKAFDSEYMTEWVREVRFLADKDIRYTYVKIKPEYGIRQYKYRKTPELFAALLEFYTQISNEKNYNKLSRSVSDATTLPDWAKSNPVVLTAKDLNELFAGCDTDGGDN